jgi:hypothetical protein
MLNFVENLLENERDPRSGLSLSDPDRSSNFLQNLASCHTAFTVFSRSKGPLEIGLEFKAN